MEVISTDVAQGMCYTKKAYYSEKMAKRVAAQIRIDRGTELRVYRCPCCAWWHLTKSERLGNESH